MTESIHVWGPWYRINAYQQQRKCIRCGYVQTENIGNPPT